jgi:predicted dehydrogenase
MPDLRVAIIGYGLAGRFFHAPLIAATAGLRVAAIVTGDPERHSQAASAPTPSRTGDWSPPTAARA